MAASVSRKEPPSSSSPNGITKPKPKPKATTALSSKLASASTTTSRTASPAPDSQHLPSSQPTSHSKPTPVTQENPDDPTQQRCKHCKEYVDKIGFSNHSKQCLRDKQEATRKKREKELRAEAEKNGTQVPEFISGKMKDGKTKADAKDLRIETGSRAGTVGLEDQSALGSAAPSLAGDAPESKKKGQGKKENAKKRKANAAALDGDTDSIAGSTTGATATGKPPNKKQKKKDAAAATSELSKDSKDTLTKSKSNSTAPNTSAGQGASGGKPKGPVDVERQCGVLLPNGGMCARSLTCKSHPMGAKRAVPGRSLPYDTLLAQWTKKNQAKQQKAAMESNQAHGDGGDGAEGGPVDSDEETEKVMAGIRRAAPRPLYERVPVSVGSRYGVVRVKEVLREAMGGSRGGGLFSLGPAAAARGVANGTSGSEEAQAQQRRASSVGGQQGGRQMSVGLGASSTDAMRKSSVGLGVTT